MLLGSGVEREGGSYAYVENFGERYAADLNGEHRLKNPLKVVAACGNGTGGPVRAAGAAGNRLRGSSSWIASSTTPSPTTTPTRKT